MLVIAGRFFLRSRSGEILLPRIVDESIGMWALRKVTGRRLWERDLEETDDDADVGVAVMTPPVKASRPAPADRPIRILTLPPSTISNPASDALQPPVAPPTDHHARRTRPASLPSRYPGATEPEAAPEPVETGH